MLVAEEWEIFVEMMKKNIELVKAAGDDTVVSSCPTCDMMWRQVYPRWAERLGLEYGLKARHYSEVVAEKIKAGEFSFPANGDEPVEVGADKVLARCPCCEFECGNGLYAPSQVGCSIEEFQGLPFKGS